MKIYTHYSDSHQDMFHEYFLKSLRDIYSREELPLTAIYHSQTTECGAFMSNGWLDTMDVKINTIIQAIEENYGNSFIFSDSDVQFFKPFMGELSKELEKYDLVTQEDRGTLCAGFFGCNANEKTRTLFSLIKENFKSMINDQVCLNHFKNTVKYSLLNREQFYTTGNTFLSLDGSGIWDNTTKIIPPKTILMHHANYVVGVENKMKMLEMIKSNYGN